VDGRRFGIEGNIPTQAQAVQRGNSKEDGLSSKEALGSKESTVTKGRPKLSREARRVKFF
jgi:hypothetical protein